MTKYNELNLKSHKSLKRVGRGIASGQGKTAGRGTKGQKSRSGHHKMPANFQGGSRSLVSAVPKKKGFKSFKVPAQVVYLGNLQDFKGKIVDNQTLFEEGFIATPFQAVKIILKGEINKALTINVFSISKNAQQAVSKAGGSFNQTAVPKKAKINTVIN